MPLVATFPVEAVPDGAVFAPHHLYVGLALCIFAGAVVWDDHRDAEPLALVGGAVVALFGFAVTWATYPATGAAFTLAGVLVALLAVLFRGDYWGTVPLRWRLLALLGVLIALDDAVSHALYPPTPLDQWFKAYIVELLPST